MSWIGLYVKEMCMVHGTFTFQVNATRNAFLGDGVKIWNGIPATLRKSTKKSFKESLKGKLFETLEL